MLPARTLGTFIVEKLFKLLKGLEIASNLSQLWVSSDYNNKQALQYLLFPDGLLYSKQNDTVRTPKVNALFQAIPLLARIPRENKKSRFRKTAKILTG